MNPLKLALLLVTFLVSSCNSNNDNKSVNSSNNQSELGAESELLVSASELKEIYEETTVVLQIGASTIFYLPVHYTHTKVTNGFEIIDRETKELAARFIAKKGSNTKKWNEKKRVLDLGNNTSIVAVNVDLSKELIYRNLGIVQRDFQKQIINNQLVVKNKNINTDGVFVKKLTDAPILFRPDTPNKLHPSIAATYDSTVNGKRYLIKRSSNIESGIEKFDLLESVNLHESSESEFRVENRIVKLDNGYSLIEFRVTNLASDKAFLISNPFHTLDLKCKDVGSPFIISSFREGSNAVVAKMILKTSSNPKCLEEETEHMEGFLFVFDVNLNSMLINY